MRRLEVRLTREPGVERVVGQLGESDRQVVFEYDPAFLADPLWLSPFKLPPEPGLRHHRERDFGPLFGLFDDSLPDGWGLLLMDRFFQQKGARLAEVSPLDRLAFLGTRTMGALTYHPPTDPAERDPRTLDLHTMAEASRRVLAGPSAEVLPQLLRAGGSPGGARPKVLVGVRGDEVLSGEDDLPEGFEPWIVKFQSERDLEDAGAVELAYWQMAHDAGIIVPRAQLFETPEGGRYFGVQRFDRRGNHRDHVHTFGNLIHADFRVPGCDYRQLLEVTRILTKNQQDVLEAFRRMVFNVLAHNRDDHVKNFAFRLTDQGHWRLAPAYDLTFSEGPGGEHSMTIDGEGRSPGRDHVMRAAESAGIARREAEGVLGEVAAAVSQWRPRARETGVGQSSVTRVETTIESCLERAR